MPGSEPITVAAAWEFACKAHRDQTDKAGKPYIGHIGRVMARVDSQEEKIVAALHDVLEDNATGRGDLLAAGVPLAIVTSVEALTRRSAESYQDFVRRAGSDPIARAVKIADLYDNSDPERLTLLPADVAERLATKYKTAIDILGARDQVGAWRACDEEERLLQRAVIATVGDPTLAAWDEVQARAVAQQRFDCRVCKSAAATIILLAHHVVRWGFGPPAFYGFRRDARAGDLVTVGVEVVEALANSDGAALYRFDCECGAFWCRRCSAPYCEQHWRPEVAFDDGFYDATWGTCPRGHRQKLDD